MSASSFGPARQFPFLEPRPWCQFLVHPSRETLCICKQMTDTCPQSPLLKNINVKILCYCSVPCFSCNKIFWRSFHYFYDIIRNFLVLLYLWLYGIIPDGCTWINSASPCWWLSIAASLSLLWIIIGPCECICRISPQTRLAGSKASVSS